jgi:predicted HTH domain antitoxin
MTMTTAVQSPETLDIPANLLERLRKGEPLLVQQTGQAQEKWVLLDEFDYRLIAAAALAFSPKETDDALTVAMRRYLKDDISLAKAAELMGHNRFALVERFMRLGLPLCYGPATIEEALEEVATLRRLREDETV